MRTVVAICALLVAGRAAADPTVLRQSLFVHAVTMREGAWVPSIAFLVKGEVPSGASLFAVYRKPDSKPWGESALRVDRADDRGVASVGAAMLDPDLSLAVGGIVKLAVELRSEGAAPRTIYAAQLRVEKLVPAGFVVEQDWLLAVAQVWADSQTMPDNPGLRVTAWFKRASGCQDLDATLSYEGKAVATTAGGQQGDKRTSETLRSTDDRDDRRYVQCRFELDTVKAYVNGRYDEAARWHDLSKHPGTYTLTIDRSGTRARTLTITIDKSGMLVKSGAIEPGSRGLRMLAPIGLVGASDGDVRKDSQPFYGGSTAPDAPVAEMYAPWKRGP